MLLTSTIHSTTNPKIIYGTAVDQVKEIADHVNVLIVEGQYGVRFPVGIKNITNEFIKAAPGTAAKQPAVVAAKEDQPLLTKGAGTTKAAPSTVWNWCDSSPACSSAKTISTIW